MASTPTPAQIAQVQTNLKNMQALNDYVYNQGGSSRILNAYFLLSEQDSSDLGLTIGLNILEGAFWAIGGMLGPVGNFSASFLSGMLSYWATSANTPPSLNTTFASTAIRIQKTSFQVDQQLAAFYNDVTGNWNTSFTYNGKTVTLADLANINFPAETDNDFYPLANAAIFALDQMIWKTILTANYVITLWELSSGQTIMPGKQDAPPIQFDESFIANNPSYYQTWSWHQSSGCGDTTGWLINEYNIGTGAGVFSDGAMSKAACQYLFIDSADGVVINQNGLYPRKTVFNDLGIRQTTHIVAVPSGGGMALSMDYKRAMVEDRTLGKLVAREGRANIHQKILDEASKNPVFARDVVARPRQTLESFLGVKIPESIYLSVIQETDRNFAIIIPAKDV